jgi:hypothetical protein
MTPDLGPLTTASIYTADLAWLKQRQLRASGESKSWLPMPDVIHALVESTQRAEEGA